MIIAHRSLIFLNSTLQKIAKSNQVPSSPPTVIDLASRPPLHPPGTKPLGEASALFAAPKSIKILHSRRSNGLEPRRPSAAGPLLRPEIAAALLRRRLGTAAEGAVSRNPRRLRRTTTAVLVPSSPPPPPRPVKGGEELATPPRRRRQIQEQRVGGFGSQAGCHPFPSPPRQARKEAAIPRTELRRRKMPPSGSSPRRHGRPEEPSLRQIHPLPST